MLTGSRCRCTKRRNCGGGRASAIDKPNHVLTPEEDENQCQKAGYGQVLHEPFLKFLKHEEGDESEVSQETERLAVEYCDPKPGEFVVGVVDLWFLTTRTNSM